MALIMHQMEIELDTPLNAHLTKCGLIFPQPTVCDNITLPFRFVRILFVRKVESFVRTVRFVCLFKPSGRTEEKRLHKNHMIVWSTYTI